MASAASACSAKCGEPSPTARGAMLVALAAITLLVGVAAFFPLKQTRRVPTIWPVRGL